MFIISWRCIDLKLNTTEYMNIRFRNKNSINKFLLYLILDYEKFEIFQSDRIIVFHF